MNTPLKATQDAVSMLRKPGTKAQPTPTQELTAVKSTSEKKVYVPFSSRITAENQLALDQLAYWSREAKVDILNTALEAYFATKSDSNNPIPVK